MQMIAGNGLNNQETIPIHDIILCKRLIVHFQPIVSMTRKTVIGFEGLIRGKVEQQIIPPKTLFEAAGEQGLLVELDRVCREKIIEAFIPLSRVHQQKLLFLNIDASIIDRVGGSNYLQQQICTTDINPQNIVIEINESKVQSVVALKRVVDTYRELGFLIAIDDIGAGFSNLNRIAHIKPDIIKIDMEIIRDIQKNYYKQEVFKSLVNLSNKIGSLVVAEGVENEDEALETLKLGGHMIQGYYFARPSEGYQEPEHLEEKIESIIRVLKGVLNAETAKTRKKIKRNYRVVNHMIKELVQTSSKEFTAILLEHLNREKVIDCAYILDEWGIQCSETVMGKHNDGQHKLLFCSSQRGFDHSLKRYFYGLWEEGRKKLLTEPYVSLATGNLCRTLSHCFLHNDKEYILCVDFLVDK